jgi:chromosome segregation ATPase
MTASSLETLQTELKYLREDFRELKQYIKDFHSTMMPKSEIELKLAEINKEIAQIKLDIVDHKKHAEMINKELERRITRRSWITHTLTAIFTALLVMGITYIFNDLTRG